MNKLLTICILALSLSACHSVEDYPDDPVGNFDALWNIIDQHYCFLDQKQVDWDSVYSVYRPHVSDKTNILELFYICSDMLNELQDGHVNLTSYFSTSYYKNWWSDYPQNFDQRLVDEHYFHFQEFSRNGLSYCMLPDSVGYIRYPQFTLATGDGDAFTMNIPMGIGVKYKLGERLNIGLEFTMRKAFSDKLDGLKDLNGVTSGFAKNTDWYSFTMISITYEFSKRCRTCHYVE